MKRIHKFYSLSIMTGATLFGLTIFKFDERINLFNRIAATNEYAICISNSELRNTFIKYSKIGNPISFEFNNNKLNNITKITGINEISFTSLNNELLLSTGYNEDDFIYERHLINDGNNKFVISLNEENYFKVTSLNDEVLNIDNFELSYSCSSSFEEYVDPRLKFTYLSDSNSYEVSKLSGFDVNDKNKECLIPSYYDDGVHGRCNVTQIASYGFKACAFEKVYIPSSVNKIDTGGFSQCVYLNNVYVPDSVTSISNYGFSKCSGLTSIRLSSNTQTFGSHVFESCANLESIHLPDSLSSTGTNTFESCTKLKSVNCPISLTKLQGSTFYYTNSLESFTISSNVTTISNSVFRSCENLKEVTYLDTIEKFTKLTKGKTWYSSCPLLVEVKCSDGVINL